MRILKSRSFKARPRFSASEESHSKVPLAQSGSLRQTSSRTCSEAQQSILVFSVHGVESEASMPWIGWDACIGEEVWVLEICTYSNLDFVVASTSPPQYLHV